MRTSTRTLLLTAIAMLLVVFATFVLPTFLKDRTGRALIGKPIVNSIATFLAPEDLQGTSFILLSDMYVDECNTRQNEFHNMIVTLRDEGNSARMLHIGSHGFPNTSYEDAVNSKRAPTHVILADESVAYADHSVDRLVKPCLIELKDGEVVEIRVGPHFEEWINGR